VGAGKPERVQQVHELIAPAVVCLLIVVFGTNQALSPKAGHHTTTPADKCDVRSRNGRDERSNHCCIDHRKTAGSTTVFLVALDRLSLKPFSFRSPSSPTCSAPPLRFCRVPVPLLRLRFFRSRSAPPLRFCRVPPPLLRLRFSLIHDSGSRFRFLRIPLTGFHSENKRTRNTKYRPADDNLPANDDLPDPHTLPSRPFEHHIWEGHRSDRRTVRTTDAAVRTTDAAVRTTDAAASIPPRI
jgi:hypothetical protein